MRDINRIDPLTNAFNKLWKKHSDMRFIQFIMYLNSELGNQEKRDTFYIEDEITLEFLNKLLNK